MRKRKIYDDKLQIDYFSDSYLKFEEDFYRYSAMVHIIREVAAEFENPVMLYSIGKDSRTCFGRVEFGLDC